MQILDEQQVKEVSGAMGAFETALAIKGAWDFGWFVGSSLYDGYGYLSEKLGGSGSFGADVYNWTH